MFIVHNVYIMKVIKDLEPTFNERPDTRFVKARAVASVLFALTSSVGVYEVSTSLVPTTTAATCAEITPQSQTAATVLANTPDSPFMTDIGGVVGTVNLLNTEVEFMRDYPGLAPDSNAAQNAMATIAGDYAARTDMQEDDETNWVVDSAAAAKDGVTLYDPRPYITPPEDDLEHGATLPFATYVDMSRKYLRQFGITRVGLVSADPGIKDRLPNNERVPSDADTDTRVAKEDVVSIMKAFSSMPAQYIRLANTHEILFSAVKNVPRSTDDAAYTYMDGPHDKIVMNISYDNDPLVMGHELAHDIDAATCGGAKAAQSDPSYTRFNDGPYDTDMPDSGVLSKEMFWTDPQVKKLEDQESKDRVAGKADAADGINNALDNRLSEVCFATDYSRTSGLEDKAEEGKVMASGNWVGVLDSETPRVKSKFLVLLARLYQRAPNTARYLSDISHKNSSADGGM